MRLITQAILLFSLAGIAAHGATWYVRPASLGEYGAEDGTSYANAFDGFDDIVFGVGGVTAGDTLIVSGTFIYGRGDFGGAITRFAITENGTAGNLLTVDGNDGVNPQGVIICARQIAAGSFTDLGDGTFKAGVNSVGSTVNTWLGDPTGTPKLLHNATDAANCVATDGSWFLDTTPNPDEWYVNPYSGDSIADFYYNWAESALTCAGRDYLHIKDLKLFGGAASAGVVKIVQASQTAANDITIENCEIAFGSYTGIRAEGFSTDNITLVDLNIHDVPTGTYTISATGGHTDWIFRRITITSGKDLDNIFANTRSDRHALGGQHLIRALFEDCTITNWAGDGILVYSGASYSCADVTIRRNFINNLNDNTSANGHWGIAQAGTSTATFSTQNSGWRVYYNLIQNCNTGATGDTAGDGSAFRLKGVSDIRIENNVVRDCRQGWFWLNNASETGMQFTIKNCIFDDMKATSFYGYGGVSTGAIAIVLDHNLYSADTSGTFGVWKRNNSNSDNFADWQSDSGQETNARLGDPLFLNAGGSFALASDFQINPTSPAYRRGTSVGLTTDYFGNTVLGTPDIGIYQVQFYGGQGVLESIMQKKGKRQ